MLAFNRPWDHVVVLLTYNYIFIKQIQLANDRLNVTDEKLLFTANRIKINIHIYILEVAGMSEAGQAFV